MIPYDILQLSSLDLSELKLVKETCLWIGDQDHSRWLFQARGGNRDKKIPLFIKIWNPSYIRRNHLLKGIESGFYDQSTTPALHAVIFSNGICRGYVMRKCLPNRKKDPEFYASILEKTAQTGYFVVQYSRYHSMIFGEKYSLVDLEGIHPLSELPLLASYYHCHFDDSDYEIFVTDLYRQRYPQKAQVQPAKLPQSPDNLPLHKVYLYRKFRALYRNLYRWSAIRLRTVFNHTERIEN